MYYSTGKLLVFLSHPPCWLSGGEADPPCQENMIATRKQSILPRITPSFDQDTFSVASDSIPDVVKNDHKIEMTPDQRSKTFHNYRMFAHRIQSLGFSRSPLTMLLAEVHVFCWNPLAGSLLKYHQSLLILTKQLTFWDNH